MKQYLLFAGRDDASLKGVQALVGDFDSFAEAFVSLVDQQTPAAWWHILDTHTGEVVERRHLKVYNGMIGFERSEWIASHAPKEEAKTAPPPAVSLSSPRTADDKPKHSPAPAPEAPPSITLPKAPDLTELDANLRSAVTGSPKGDHANSKLNGHVSGAVAGH